MKVQYETAKLAKEKGFKFTYPKYDNGGYENGFHSFFQHRQGKQIHALSHFYVDTNANGQQWMCLDTPAPRQSDLQKWLREEHKIDILVEEFWRDDKSEEKVYVGFFSLPRDREFDGEIKEEDYKGTYEEALEDALLTSLSYIK